MKTRLFRWLMLLATLLLVVDGAWAGAIPKYGHYKGTVRVAKTWPSIGTTRSAQSVIAIYFDSGLTVIPPLNYVTLQYRPSPFVEHFWAENLTNAVMVTNVGPDGNGYASAHVGTEWISGVVAGQRTSMVIKMSRTGDNNHPTVDIIINLKWIKPL